MLHRTVAAPPPFDSFAAGLMPTDPAALVDLLRADQVRRWRVGERLPVERYLTAFPQLAGTPDDQLVLIAGELDLRRQLGLPFSLADFQSRFPAFADDLAIQFALQCHFKESSVEGDRTAPLAKGEIADFPEVPGYTLFDELGRGGMGTVCRAADDTFGRDVAVKFMTRVTTDPETIRRFLDESRITARLQHPGIPPVYNAGTLRDGRPFLAMKLIRGRTLDELLGPAAAPLTERGRFLATFEFVCQAVGYAHSRGVIHRDLKPGNIMVGAFGEVQVMDWGLAKVLGVADVGEAEEVPPTAREIGDGSGTETGTLLGTPAFMAPEQAAGGKVDRTSDVYGLGGILCVILTGKPPHARDNDEPSFSLPTPESILDRCFPRLDLCGAEAELIAIAKKCLAPDPRLRYADGGEVAAAVADFRAGLEARARQAELARARLEVQVREEAKRRRVRRMLSVAVAALIGLTVAVTLWRQDVIAQQTARDAQASQYADLEILRADDQRKRFLLEDALQTLEQARSVLEPTNEDDRKAALDRHIEAARFRLELDRIRLSKAGFTVRDKKRRDAVVRYRESFRARGFDLFGDPLAAAAKVADSPLRDDIIAALDDWSESEQDNDGQQEKVLAVTAAALGEPERNQIWHQTDLESFTNAVAALRKPTPGLLIRAAWQMDHLGGDGTAVLDRGLARHPTDFWLHLERGNLAMTNHRDPAGAESAYRAAVAARPNVAGGHRLLGNALFSRGKYDLASEAFRAALAIDPEEADALTGLGDVQMELGRPDAAAPHFRRAIEIAPDLVAARVGIARVLIDKHNFVESMEHLKCAERAGASDEYFFQTLGRAYLCGGQFAEALDAFDRVIARQPGNTWNHFNRGVALRGLKRERESIRAFEKAIDLDGTNDAAWNAIGYILFESGEYAAALNAFEKAVAIDPKFASHQFGLGGARWKRGDLVGAIEAFREAAKSGEPAYHDEFASALHTAGSYDEAIAEYREALRLGVEGRQTRKHLGIALRQAGRFAESADELRKAGEEKEFAITQRAAVVAGKLDTNTEPADAAERVEFARVAGYRKDFARAAKLYAAVPGLAGEARIDAARVSARLGMHAKARQLLREELASLATDANAKIAAGQWMAFPDFRTVPEGERGEWDKLWAEVRHFITPGESHGR